MDSNEHPVLDDFLVFITPLQGHGADDVDVSDNAAMRACMVGAQVFSARTIIAGTDAMSEAAGSPICDLEWFTSRGADEADMLAIWANGAGLEPDEVAVGTMDDILSWLADTYGPHARTQLAMGVVCIEGELA